MTSRAKWIVALVVVCAVVVVAVIYWGQKKPTSPAETTPTAPTKPQPPTRIQKITFAIDWKAVPEYAPYFIAHEKGFDRKHGIDLQIVEGNGAPDNAKLIGQGKYKIGTCSGFATVVGRSKGMDIVSVAVIYQKSPVVIFSLAEKGITKPQDLIGKTIGLHYNSVEYQEYRALMRKLGIDRSKIHEVGVGWEVQPLLTGQVDAMTGYSQNQPVQIEVEGKKVNRIFVADYGIDTYGTNIIANGQFLSEEPATVKAVVDAILEAWEYTRDHFEEAVSIYRKLYPEQEEAFVRQSLQKTLELVWDTPTRKIGEQSAERWQSTIDMIRDLGIITNPPSVQEMYATIGG